jgi:hypothetical protein
MHKHMRRADYVLHCDATDHALAAIITVAPSEETSAPTSSSPTTSRGDLVLCASRTRRLL